MNATSGGQRYWVVKHTILTAAILVPLLWSFIFVRNHYTFTAWDVIMARGDLERGRS
jgi:hypothetical protein